MGIGRCGLVVAPYFQRTAIDSIQLHIRPWVYGGDVIEAPSQTGGYFAASRGPAEGLHSRYRAPTDGAPTERLQRSPSHNYSFLLRDYGSTSCKGPLQALHIYCTGPLCRIILICILFYRRLVVLSTGYTVF